MQILNSNLYQLDLRQIRFHSSTMPLAKETCVHTFLQGSKTWSPDYKTVFIWLIHIELLQQYNLVISVFLK